MITQPSISVVIPAYNEEERLEATVCEAADYFRAIKRHAEIIVVDDGSRDGTSALVRRLASNYTELRLIRLPANRGKGYAVRTGVINSRGVRILFTDADGSTPIVEVERLDAALDEGADIAIGSRVVSAVDVRVSARWYRRLIGRAFHVLVSFLTVRGIHDTQCGFKLFRANVAHHLFSRMRMDGFSFDVEVLLMAQREEYSISEVAINWVHKPGSRVNIVSDSVRMACDLVVMRLLLWKGKYAQPHLSPVPELFSNVVDRG